MLSRISIRLMALSGAVLAVGTFGLIGTGVLYIAEERLTVLAYTTGLISLAAEQLILDDLLMWTLVIATPVLGWMGFRVFERIWAVEINILEPADNELPLGVEDDDTSPASAEHATKQAWSTITARPPINQSVTPTPSAS